MENKNKKSTVLNTIEEALIDIKAGKVIIVVDDEDRENEGDFVAAAEHITAETVNFMARHGRGLICAPLPKERCEELKLDMMVGENTSLHSTPFTVSVDLLDHGCTTGISAADRAATLRSLMDKNTTPAELGRPGHIFPLRAQTKGVLRRPGHTEAVVDLTRLAGLEPGGALVEIMNEDGTMARLPQLLEVAKTFNLKIVSIADLIRYRLKRETIIKQGVTALLPTAYGDFKIIPFIQESNDIEHIALVKGSWKDDESILVRMHSSCMTGDIFGSCRCDCGAQLHESMRLIEKEGKGVIVYLQQEGRGIGIFNKIHAYKLQDEGLNTVEANVKLGFAADERDYGVGASILNALGVKNIRLLTNNPLKRAGLEGYGLKIVQNVPLIIAPNEYNISYLKTKQVSMGHTLGFDKKDVK
ncbi:MAG: bifunctional 3,4-dihydroxy-2-butanone-4-phosphate synthase/GTP cyclohydrolase II [Rikenellaceae bacterium]